MVHGSRADRGGDRGRFSVSSCLLGEKETENRPLSPCLLLNGLQCLFSEVCRSAREQDGWS